MSHSLVLRIVRAVVYVLLVLAYPAHSHAGPEDYQVPLTPFPVAESEIPRVDGRIRRNIFLNCLNRARAEHGRCEGAVRSSTTATGAVAGQAARAGQTASQRTTAQGMEAAATTAWRGQLLVTENCNVAEANCKQSCEQSRTWLEELRTEIASEIRQVEARMANDPNAASEKQRLEGIQNQIQSTARPWIDSVQTACTGIMGQRRDLARAGIPSSVRASQEATAVRRAVESEAGRESSSLLDNEWLTYGAVGAAGLGAGYLLFGNDDKKDNKPSTSAEGSANKSSETSNTNNQNTPDCSSPTEVSKDACRNHYISVCSSNSETSGCKEFDAAYCEAKASGSGDGQTTAAPGAGTPYCTLASSRKYCAAGANPSAPACLWLISRGAACKNNPASAECLPQYESQAKFQQACAAFQGDPLCGSSLASMIGQTGNVPSGNSGQSASRVIAGGNGNTGSVSGTTGVQSDRTYVNFAAQDIDQRFGKNIFEKSSGAIRGLCDSGQLSDCKARPAL